MEFRVRGLKCDNPSCGWSDMDISFEEYPKWLGRPCPLCGRIVLTRKDMDAVNAVRRICGSKIVRFLERAAEHGAERRMILKGRMNGNGKIEFTDVREEQKGGAWDEGD